MIKIGVPMVFRLLMRKCSLYICEFDKVYLVVWSGVVLLLCGSLSNGWGKTSHSRAVSCHQDLQLLWTFQGHWCGMILCFLVHRASLPDGFCWFCRRRLFKFKCKCPVCSLEKDAKDTSNQCLVQNNGSVFWDVFAFYSFRHVDCTYIMFGSITAGVQNSPGRFQPSIVSDI